MAVRNVKKKVKISDELKELAILKFAFFEQCRPGILLVGFEKFRDTLYRNYSRPQFVGYVKKEIENVKRRFKEYGQEYEELVP